MAKHNDMRALLDRIYSSFENADASAYLDNMSEDAVGIGTDEAEWWVGRDAMAPIIQAQLAEMSGAGIRMSGEDPIIGESGDVVWASVRPTLHLPDGSSQQLRATVVATREGDGLKIRQMHLSVGAPNEEVVQMELTT